MVLISLTEVRAGARSAAPHVYNVVCGRNLAQTRRTSAQCLIFSEPTRQVALLCRECSVMFTSPRSELWSVAVPLPLFLSLFSRSLLVQVVVDPNINSEGVLAEAMYFGVQSMVEALHSMHVSVLAHAFATLFAHNWLLQEDMARTEQGPAELTRGDVIRIIAMAGPMSSRVRLQGVNLSGLGTNTSCAQVGCRVQALPTRVSIVQVSRVNANEWSRSVSIGSRQRESVDGELIPLRFIVHDVGEQHAHEVQSDSC